MSLSSRGTANRVDEDSAFEFFLGKGGYVMSSIVLDLWGQDPPDGLVQYSDAEVLTDQTGDDQRLNRIYSNVSQPNFSILIYPAVPSDLSNLGSDAGPMFVVNGGQDTLTRPQGAIRLCLALVETGVPAELHLFRQGEHGFGLGNTGGSVRRWMDLCEEWMRELGYL